MPGPSGLDLQEAFAKSGDSVPIVFLSGHGDIPTSVRAIKAGAVDFLTKPVAKKVLLSAVESALARDEKNRSDRARLTDLGARYKSLTPRDASAIGTPTMVPAWDERYSDLRAVTGWVRTRLWRTGRNSARSSWERAG